MPNYEGYEGRFAVVTTTTVLIRSAARICSAEAAVVVVDHEISAVGLGAGIAVELMARVDAGAPLPGGWILIRQLRVPLTQAGRSATLSIFDRTPRTIDPATAAAVAVIAEELGTQLAARTAAQREQLGAGFDELMEQVAGGIDSINDAAAIFEWPRIGSIPRILYVNLPFESLFGYRAAAAIGQTAELLYGSLTDTDRLAFMNDRVREAREARNTIVLYRSDGVPTWIELSLHGVTGAAADASCMVATLRDVTMRKEFELAIAKEKRKLQVTLAAIGDGVITTIPDGRIDFVNAAARAMFGIDAAEAYGESIADVLRLTDPAGATIDVLHTDGDSAGVARGQALFERGSMTKHIAFVTSPIADEGFVVVLRDVTAQHRLATQLSYEASHDPLTSMYNRRKFDELLEDAIEAAQRGEGSHALAFLDLDRFKYINDTCGHAAGDRVLLDLAHLLQQQLRGRDVLARIGGDEFAVLLHECTLEQARQVVEKLRLAVQAYRLIFGGVSYGVGVSIGIATIDGTDNDAAAIFRRADEACYAAKHLGRDALAR